MALRELLAPRNQYGWRGLAWLRRNQFEGNIETLKSTLAPDCTPEQEPPALKELRAHFDRADNALRGGESPDETWQKLHRVEEGIARLASGDLLLEYAIWALHHGDDPALRGHADFLESSAYKTIREVAVHGGLNGKNEAEVARRVAQVMNHVHAVTDEKHLESNERRRRLMVMAWCAAGLSGLVVLAAIALDDLPFLVGTDSFAGVSAAQVALLVALGGLVGGSWGAFPALTNSKRDRYRIYGARALLRVSMGMLAALIGVSLVGASWVDSLTASSAPALFAVALAFGLTQEPITKILESKATKGSSADDEPDAA